MGWVWTIHPHCRVSPVYLGVEADGRIWLALALDDLKITIYPHQVRRPRVSEPVCERADPDGPIRTAHGNLAGKIRRMALIGEEATGERDPLQIRIWRPLYTRFQLVLMSADRAVAPTEELRGIRRHSNILFLANGAGLSQWI